MKTISESKQKSFKGEFETCAHRVAFWFDTTGIRMTADDKRSLRREAYQRARHCIIRGFISGDLNGWLPGDAGGDGQSFRGAWQIK